MSTPRYWRRLARLFYHYRKKSSRLPYLPIRMWIELTSHCNYRCIMCPNKDLPKTDKGYMEFPLYAKIIAEAADFAFDINLAHRGESLLHPRLIDMIRTAKDSGLFTRLHTNGSVLTEDLARQIVSAGLDRLSFSFDGTSKAAYEKIRIGGDFDKTIGNIIRMLEIKKELGSKKPETAIEVINFDDVARDELAKAESAFRDRFRGLPLDGFVMKDLHNWAGEIAAEKKSGHYALCPFPWNALVIFWDGKVLPCTQDFFGQTVVGDANTQSLKDIWNGDNLHRLREALAARRLETYKPCSQCDRMWRKSFLGIPKEYLWKFLTKRMP